MQFIFDRAKASDPLKLNEIYSHTKKHRQLQSSADEKGAAKNKLEDAITNSMLPTELKNEKDYHSDEIFKNGSFLHFVCRYYKMRQKARAGRLFIHPEYRLKKRGGKDIYVDTGRFDDENSMLTYCNRMPRQKRYQLLNDISGLLMLPPEQLCKHLSINESDTEEEVIHQWLVSVKGLKTNAEKAAKAQKEYRGELAAKIKKGNIKELRSLCDKATDLHQSIYESLAITKACDDKVASIYFLAQVHNIAFKDRSGNANTCVVC
ncbi:MAG: type II-B CRISPR-associated RNA-guided endonuclease Cas9/Csx12, partial [Pseudomonadota bacterium]|nr:type II-B CRISPR-associated RNA-guided endonuclease Cas9/Csx12 [Pseudomonadota bacterium]